MTGHTKENSPIKVEDLAPPLLVHARHVVGDYAAQTAGYEIYESDYRNGDRDNDSEIIVAIAALRRGMELYPNLTQEAMRETVEAIIQAYHTTRITTDFVPHILTKPRVQAAFAALTQPPHADKGVGK